jgi:hypothetical protein
VKLGTRSPVFLIICPLLGVDCQMLMLIVGCSCMPVVGVCLVVRCQLSSILTVDCGLSLSVVVVGCCLFDVDCRVLKVDCLLSVVSQFFHCRCPALVTRRARSCTLGCNTFWRGAKVQ